MLGTRLTLGLLATAVTVVGVSHTAAASMQKPGSPTISRQAQGAISLFERPDLSGSLQRHTYGECRSASPIQTHGVVMSFINEPLPGCQAVLVKHQERAKLCVGRGTVPVRFSASPQLRIEPATSEPCSTLP